MRRMVSCMQDERIRWLRRMQNRRLRLRENTRWMRAFTLGIGMAQSIDSDLICGKTHEFLGAPALRDTTVGKT